MDEKAHEHRVDGEVHGMGFSLGLPGLQCCPPDVGVGVCEARVAANAGAHYEIADLAPQLARVGDDGPEIDVVGHAVERAALHNQFARLLRDGGLLGVVDDGLRMGDLALGLQESRDLHGRSAGRARTGRGRPATSAPLRAAPRG